MVSGLAVFPVKVQFLLFQRSPTVKMTNETEEIAISLVIFDEIFM